MTYSRAQTLVFTYGTLRPGCGNDRMLGDYIHVGRATAHGALHYHECGHYPIYRPFDLDGWEPDSVTHGDILLVSDRELVDVLRMEVLAGYNAEWADVKVYRWPDEPKRYEHLEALTFPWRREYYGDRIESGDWTTTPNGLVAPRRKDAA